MFKKGKAGATEGSNGHAGEGEVGNSNASAVKEEFMVSGRCLKSDEQWKLCN